MLRVFFESDAGGVDLRFGAFSPRAVLLRLDTAQSKNSPAGERCDVILDLSWLPRPHWDHAAHGRCSSF